MKFVKPALLLLLLMPSIGLAAGQLSKQPQLVIDAQGFSGVRIQRVAVSNDGRWVAAAGGKVVRIWNVRTRELYTTLRGYQEPGGYHVGFIDSIRFSPDSRYLAVGVSDNDEEHGSTRIYDLERPNEIHGMIKGHLGCTRGIAFSHQGDLIATWGCDGNLFVYRWDAASGDATRLFTVRWRESGLDLRIVDKTTFEFSDDDRYLVFTFGYQVVVSIEKQRAIRSVAQVPASIASTGQRISNLRLPNQELLSTKFTQPYLKYSGRGLPNGVWYVLGGTTAKANSQDRYWICAWGRKQQPIAKFKLDFTPTALDWNERAGVLAGADLLGNIFLWDIVTGQRLGPPIKPRSQKVWFVRWLEDGDLAYGTKPYGVGEFGMNWRGAPTMRLDPQQLLLDRFAGNVRPMPQAQKTQAGTLTDGIVGRSNADPYNEQRISLHLLAGGKRYNLQPELDDRVERITSPQYLAATSWLNPHISQPMSIQAVRYQGQPANGSFIVGTQGGELYECVLASGANGRPEMKIIRKFLGHTSYVTSISVSPDATKFATSSLDGTIRIWKLDPPRILGDADLATDGTSIRTVGPMAAAADVQKGDVLQGFDDYSYYERIVAVRRGEYSPGQEVVLSLKRFGQNDPEVKGVNIKRKIRLARAPDLAEPLLSFYFAETGDAEVDTARRQYGSPGEWVAWTQDGHYDASANGARNVGWHVNRSRGETAEFFRFDQFQRELYNRAIVQNVLRYNDAKVAADRITEAAANTRQELVPIQADDAEQFSRRLPPQIQIVTPKYGTRHEGKVKFRVEVANDGKNAIQRVDVAYSSATLGSLQLVDQRKAPGQVVSIFEGEFEMVAGEHNVSIHAVDDAQLNDTKEVRFAVAGSAPDKPNLYVLAIGVSTYKNANFTLKYADKDAKEFANAWASQAGKAYGRVVTKVIVNEDATKSAIEDGLAWLAGEAIDPKDHAYVLLAGHGIFDARNTWNFGTHEMQPNKPTSMVRQSMLFDYFQDVRSKLIVFADTCHGAGVRAVAGARGAGIRQNQVFRIAQKTSLVSCKPEEKAIETEAWENGAFTEAILKFLDQRVDPNGDGEQTFFELSEYVTSQVPKMTGELQHPEMASNGGGRLVLTKLP